MPPRPLPSQTIELLREISGWPDEDRALLFEVLAGEPETGLRLARALRITSAIRAPALLEATAEALEERYCLECGAAVREDEEHDCPVDDEEDFDDEDDEDSAEQGDPVSAEQGDEKKEGVESGET